MESELAAQIRATLALDGGWLTRNALLNRCTHARDGDEMQDELAGLLAAGRIQRRSGPVGTEYATLGTQPPMETVGEARAPASVAETLVSVPPRPEKDFAALRHQNIAERHLAVRAQLIEAFRAKPVRTCTQLQAMLGRSQPVVSGYLRALCADGVIRRVGKARETAFHWVGEQEAERASVATGAPVSPPPEPAPPQAARVVEDLQPSTQDEHEPDAEPAFHEVMLASGDDLELGYFSDGRLEVRMSEHTMVFPPQAAKRLAAFTRAHVEWS